MKNRNVAVVVVVLEETGAKYMNCGGEGGLWKVKFCV